MKTKEELAEEALLNSKYAMLSDGTPRAFEEGFLAGYDSRQEQVDDLRDEVNWLNNIIEERDGEIGKLKAAQTKWISVKDDLPKIGQLVFIKFKAGKLYNYSQHTEAYLDNDSPSNGLWWEHLGGEAWDFGDVAYWMPLPEGPKGE